VLPKLEVKFCIVLKDETVCDAWCCCDALFKCHKKVGLHEILLVVASVIKGAAGDELSGHIEKVELGEHVPLPLYH
jgi:hypothetical protein